MELQIWLSTSRTPNRIWNSSITMVMKLKLHPPTGDSTNKSSRKQICGVFMLVLEQNDNDPSRQCLYFSFESWWQRKIFENMEYREDIYPQIWVTPDPSPDPHDLPGLQPISCVTQISTGAEIHGLLPGFWPTGTSVFHPQHRPWLLPLSAEHRGQRHEAWNIQQVLWCGQTDSSGFF